MSNRDQQKESGCPWILVTATIKSVATESRAISDPVLSHCICVMCCSFKFLSLKLIVGLKASILFDPISCSHENSPTSLMVINIHRDKDDTKATIRIHGHGRRHFLILFMNVIDRRDRRGLQVLSSFGDSACLHGHKSDKHISLA